MFDGASELQLDCMVEESSGSATVKHDGLLSLADLSQPDNFHAPPHNGPSLTDMSSPLPVEPNDIKLDPAAGDTSASIGESVFFSFKTELNTANSTSYLRGECLIRNLENCSFKIRSLIIEKQDITIVKLTSAVSE